jgi:hypothetical protein
LKTEKTRGKERKWDCVGVMKDGLNIIQLLVYKALQRSVFSPNGAGSNYWSDPVVPVLAAGEDHRLLGTDQW